MFECANCKQHKKSRERALGNDWCSVCYDAEAERSRAEDDTGTRTTMFDQEISLRSRPPKYMLRPEQYAEFGYEEGEK